MLTRVHGGRRYQKRGFVFGYISHYEGMETGDIVARVVEGRVNKVNVVQVDDEGNPKKGSGEVQPEIILREMPFKVRSCACDAQKLVFSGRSVVFWSPCGQL